MIEQGFFQPIVELRRRNALVPNLSCFKYRFHQLIEACFSLYDLGVTEPIIAGIMPITNSTQLLRFSDACGAEIPRWIRLRLQSYGDDIASIRAFGEEVVTDLCDQLLTAGAPGLHFYSLNQADAVLAIADNLDLTK